MEFADTHCHIQSAGLAEGERATREVWAKSDLNGDSLVKSALESGVTRMICVGCDLGDSKLAAEFAQKYPQTWSSIGIHPHEAQHYVQGSDLEAAKLDEFSALASQPKVVAVGECGLDFYYAHSPKEAQIAILRFQIELALERDLPVIFHVREAFDEFWPIFEGYSGVRGVLHSFTDSLQNMQKATAAGLFIGVNGIATFTRDAEQLAVYRAIPSDKLLLETDSPFLTPTPYRGNINEPRRVTTIADFVSDLRGESRETLSDVTTSNARKLFGI